MRSHSIQAIIEALASGQKVWRLDTGTSGEDDLLIGTRDQVEADICHHFERDDLPEGWELIEVTEIEHECPYCGATIVAGAVPAVGETTGAVHRDQHSEGCEWVETRAHWPVGSLWN
jgi:hypothetical protein